MTDYEWDDDRGAITAPWADYYLQIRRLVLQGGVTSIGSEAFDTCSNLTEVRLPNTLTRIGEYALQSCSFTEITLPDALTELGDGAFYDCRSLQNIELPSGITAIMMYLFCNCTSLESVTIPAGVTGIGESAFSGCSALGRVRFLGTMEQWRALAVETGNGALYGAEILCSDGAMDYSDMCGPNLTWSFEESSGTLTISGTGATWEDAFPWEDLRGQIRRVAVEEGVTQLGSHTMIKGAFQDCVNLTLVSLPESLTQLGGRCFQNCDSLVEVALPAGLQVVGQGAFGDCDSLLRLPVPESSESFAFVDGVLYSKDMSTLIVCPGGIAGEFTVPDSVTAFGVRPFWGCRKLTAVHIPDTVTDLGNNTFQYCVSLREVNIPAGVSQLPISCFYGCSSLEEITVPANVTSFYGYTFIDCTALKKVTFLGSAPQLELGGTIFDGVTATAYYPAGDGSWTVEYRRSLGGSITWVAAVSTSAFPDPAFRAWVEENVDHDGNRRISDAELEAVTGMDVSGLGIASLEGIQYFPQLQALDCSSNALTELDLGGNPLLTELFCSDNELTSLNLEGNPLLTELFCNGNELTSLNLSVCPELERLACYHNALETLELRFCPALAQAAQETPRTGSFGADVLLYGGSGDNFVLAVDRELNFQDPDSPLPITETLFPDPAFRSYVAENLDRDKDGFLSPEELDAVTGIVCNGPGWESRGDITSLKGIEYFPKLKQLYCFNNQITELDLSHNTEIESVFCYDNDLQVFIVGAKPRLKSLDCNGNFDLAALDVSYCPELTDLIAEHTSIGSIDVSKNTKLQYLDVLNCGLRELDVTSNHELETLYCYSNNLTTLDVSHNPRLQTLLCDYNNLQSLDVSANPELSWLRCRGCGITSLDLHANPELTKLGCANNELTSLDLSANTKLTELDCSRNDLTELDLSANPDLDYLVCCNSRIGILDLSSCPILAEAGETEPVPLENYGSGAVGYGAYQPYEGSTYIQYHLVVDGSTRLVTVAVPGDLNGNGTVESGDLLRLRRYLVGALPAVNRKAADVNGDGEVDILDLVRLRKYLAGEDVPLG